jgi:L-tartrate/succinate antiporter
LAKLGPITGREYTMAALVLGALGFWVFGGSVMDATMVALAAISLMLICRVVSWNDILANTPAWNVLAWFATLVVLADGLNKVGFVAWLGKNSAALLAGHSPILVMLALVVLFFVVHYMFASLTAHTTAVMPVVLAAGAAVPGLPVREFALLLSFSLGIMGVLTPYATGPAPLYYASGFVPRKDFWRLGAMFGLMFLLVLLLLGWPYLKARMA